MKRYIYYHCNMEREIVLARVLGFCSGVKRAMTLALQTRENFPFKKIFTFGELIHNREAIRLLESKKIYALDKKTALENSSENKEAVIIVCAHGIETEALTALQHNFSVVVDATCPHVLQSERKAEQAVRNGAAIILVGEKRHQEILSIKSYGEKIPGGKCYCIQDNLEAENFSFPCTGSDIAVIGQTTLKKEEYENIVNILSKKILNARSRQAAQINEFKVFDTICPATQKRQEALIELASGVEAVVVIGGKNSTNTQRLFQTACALNAHSFLVENADELPPEIFTFTKIGLTAGASTPDFVINEIKARLENKDI